MQVFMIARGEERTFETTIVEARKVAREKLPDNETATVFLADTGKLTAPRIVAIAAAMDKGSCTADALFESIRAMERHIGQPSLVFESVPPDSDGDDGVPGSFGDGADPELTAAI